MPDETETGVNPENEPEQPPIAAPPPINPPGGRSGGSYTPSDKTNYKSSQKGVIALGIYLLLMIIFSVMMLAVLMMGGECVTAGCRAANSNINANINSNVNSSNQNANENTNRNTNSNANSNTNANAAAPVNTNASPSPTGTATAAATASPAKSPTPSPTPEMTQDFVEPTIPPFVPVRYFGTISANSYVFLTVLFAGMLGGTLRGIYSFVRHLGLGDFSFNWTWFYLTLPFTGAVLSLILYFVIRGGFYDSAYGEGLVLNLFSFAALAVLTGLFTDNAMEKLKQIATTLLADVTPKVENAKEIEDKKKVRNQRNSQS